MGAPRYARKVDSNQPEIVSALRGIGVGVHVASSAGNGLTDLLCASRGVLYLLEVKNLEGRGKSLTVDQVRLHDMLRQHGVTVHVVTGVDEALAVFGAR